MALTNRLLEQAYNLVQARRFRDAALALDTLLREEPRNIEAWELYLQISSTREELARLARRVCLTAELSADEKETILSYQRYRLRRLQKKPAGLNRPVQHQWGWAVLIAIPFLGGLVLSAAHLIGLREGLLGGLFLAGLIGWLITRKRSLSDGDERARLFASEVLPVDLSRQGEAEPPLLTLDAPIIQIGPEGASITKTGGARFASYCGGKREESNTSRSL